MTSNSFCSFIPFLIMGTLSTITVVYNYYIKNNNHIDDINDIVNDIDVNDIDVNDIDGNDIDVNDIDKIFSDKNIQTESDSVGLTVEKEIQCEFDILDLEESGELEAVQARSGAFRWLILKVIG